MTDTTSGEHKGLLDSLTTLASTLVAVTHTRLDLLSNDLEEDREHVMAILVSTLITLFCLGVGVVLASILLVVLCWNTHPFLVLGALAGSFLLAGMVALAFLMHKVKTKPRMFATSLSELSKDRQELVNRL
ncbi:phage holin family protein [Sulfuriferula nivalis]|uniref:Phage holin family protein n=1 Tax=Sulfuriferula nivalis TaxID=2675298 RepID=A0A809RJ40_9PROT|nr:phage holin family protein [Sulfuriferula nivalis]BBP01939.1 hypothetical protein SFSGTM_26470 [Sulfuriferula nivalis]